MPSIKALMVAEWRKQRWILISAAGATVGWADDNQIILSEWIRAGGQITLDIGNTSTGELRRLYP